MIREEYSPRILRKCTSLGRQKSTRTSDGFVEVLMFEQARKCKQRVNCVVSIVTASGFEESRIDSRQHTLPQNEFLRPVRKVEHLPPSRELRYASTLLRPS
jgi:hypothetical protein